MVVHGFKHSGIRNTSCDRLTIAFDFLKFRKKCQCSQDTGAYYSFGVMALSLFACIVAFPNVLTLFGKPVGGMKKGYFTATLLIFIVLIASLGAYYLYLGNQKNSMLSEEFGDIKLYKVASWGTAFYDKFETDEKVADVSRFFATDSEDVARNIALKYGANTVYVSRQRWHDLFMVMFWGGESGF